jgi:hypothetical protein
MKRLLMRMFFVDPKCTCVKCRRARADRDLKLAALELAAAFLNLRRRRVCR